LLPAFGFLATAAAVAACSTSVAPTPQPTSPSAQASTVARHGIIRPPPRAATPRQPDAKRLFNASYPATGGCGTPLVYYGGPIIADPIVVQVSWNDPVTNGTVPSSVETYLQSWWPAIISPEAGYLSWLTEYSTAGKPGQDGAAGSNQTFSGHGTYGSTFHITPSVANQGATLTDTMIAAELVAQIDAFSLPAPTFDATGHCNTIYMIDFPPSVTSISLTFGGSTIVSCNDFCGYHGGTAYQGSYIYYGVMPDVTSACTSCMPDGLNQDLGLLHSHELAEAITDAEIDAESLTTASTDFMRPGGWDQWAPGCSEIGDSCAWPAQAGSALPTVTYAGAQYYVQGLFDNARMDCEVSGPTTAGCTTSSCTNPDLPVCKAGSCQACAADTDCSGNASGGACQPSGACGQCSATNASACSAPTPYCATATGTCVACTTSANCGEATPICDAFTSSCRACQAADCLSPTPVCETSGSKAGQCVQCSTSAQCAAPFPSCDEATGTCIAGCTTNSECAGDTPVCDATSHQCRSCVTNADCSTSTNHVCDIGSGACVACTQATGCTVGTCNTTTHSCVQCLSDSECNNPTPICDTAGNDSCRPCASDAECAGNSHGPVCSGGSCTPAAGRDGGTTMHDGGSIQPGDGGSTQPDSGTTQPGDSGTSQPGDGSDTDAAQSSGGGGGSSGGCSMAPASRSSLVDVSGGLLAGLAVLAMRRRRSV
jgi:hypothetical protein